MNLNPFHYLNFTIISIILTSMILTSCNSHPEPDHEFSGEEGEIQLMTLNPGHFHAALVQKDMLRQVDPTVYIFAPEGNDLNLHIERIEGFNNRDDNPTNWELDIYTGEDYLDRMLSEQPGNVMVVAGNNRSKTDYILQAVNEGINVLSDKPMAIDSGGWAKLNDAFRLADERGVLLYDIMTERYEVTSRIQRILAQNRDLFGDLETGSFDDPAIIKESIHHLFKTVAGSPLRRPPWYFDVTQQGEGIVDVTTHLVDLSLWGTFPDEPIYHEQDIEMIDAERWPTMLTAGQFENITGMADFPEYLQDQLEDGVLPYYSNGEINFTLRGHHVNVSVQWDYQAPEGGDDSHFSLMRGTKSNLVIRQGAEQNFRSTLFVEPVEGADADAVASALEAAVQGLQDEFPGVSYTESDNGWQLEIPGELYLGHEAHFGKVAEAYFGYLMDGELPEWEVPNMITKYFITTQARELAMD
jgi:predicted dehydrogenase